MRTRLLIPLIALLAAVPARAQDDTRPFNITVTIAGSPRAVYHAAMHALEREGYSIRARFLDELLLTFPLLDKKSGRDSLASELYVELAPRGDSTVVSFQARVAHASGREVSDDQVEAAGALTMTAQVAIAGGIATALDEVPEYARKPGPREDSDEFGYGRRNPIRVGGGVEDGAANQRRYLDGLRGPEGQQIRYFRLGSCCPFSTPNGTQGRGRLDAYEVHYDGLDHPVLLFLDLYTAPDVPPPAPDGFTLAPAGGGK